MARPLERFVCTSFGSGFVLFAPPLWPADTARYTPNWPISSLPHVYRDETSSLRHAKVFESAGVRTHMPTHMVVQRWRPPVRGVTPVLGGPEL